MLQHVRNDLRRKLRLSCVYCLATQRKPSVSAKLAYPQGRNEVCRIGDQKGRIGDQKGRIGDQKGRIGDQKGRIGDQKGGIWDHSPGIMDRKPWDQDQQCFKRLGIRLYHFCRVRDPYLSFFLNQQSEIWELKWDQR